MNFEIVDSQFSNNCERFIVNIGNSCFVEIAAIVHNSLLHLCFPTQIGCSIHCIHCATTYSEYPFCGNIGFETLNELCGYFINRYSNHRIVLSFSGHGEPMMNWNNVYSVACRYKNDVEYVYITTVGIKSILNSIENTVDPFVRFYFSIHGGNDNQRFKLIPPHNYISNLSEIIDFSNKYVGNNGYIVWNYMVHSCNCSDTDAEQFVSLLSKIRVNLDVRFTSYVNIINTNNTENSVFPANAKQFSCFVNRVLEHQNELPNISFRISKIEGEDINVACGQMRAHFLPNCKDSI